MNLPNKLTLLRVGMIPFFLFFFFASWLPGHMLIAFVVFALGSLTDMVDGHIARKYHLITDFGKLMDPLADKLLVLAALVCILGDHYVLYPLSNPDTNLVIALITMVIVLGRDLVVNSIRLVAASGGVVIAADGYGKLKTIFQMVWLCWALLGRAIAIPAGITEIYSLLETALYAAMMFFTIVSGYNYVYQNRKLFADA